jgi:DNA-binding MarR family transcriptional regulator/energy-coupling factor transporter ATP-binding protein EcfA2
MLSNTPIEDLCRKLRPLLGEQIEKLYLKYSVSTDLKERLEVEKLVHALYHKHLGKSLLNDEIMLEPPQGEEIKGNYQLGTVMYADNELYPFGMREQDWIRHMCVTGMSGSGKTTFAYTMLGAMILKNKPFLVFDWKRSFRPLLKAHDKTLVFTIGNESIKNFFRVNINIPPPGVGPRQWISILADMLSEAYQTSFGVHKILTEVLDKAYNDFKVYEGSHNYPNWHQIKDRLEKMQSDLEQKRSSREYEWVTSALRIAHGLTFGSFGEVINYKGKELIDVADLLKQQVVFELDGLSNSEKKFFTQYILTYIYKKLKSDPDNLTNEFKHMILVDEAHNIFLKDRPQFMEESVTEMIFREIREFGESLVCLDQHISKLADVVSGNSACNIAFQQQLPEDIRDAAELMQLNDRRDDKKKYFSMLPVGHAIVKLAERYHNPFLIKAPFINIKKNRVNDAILEEVMGDRVKTVKKMESFATEAFEEEKKAKQKDMEAVFYTSGVDARTSEEFLDYQAQKKEYQENRKPVHNHLQRDLVLIVSELVKKGIDLKNAKDALVKRGFKRSDISVAISNLDYDLYLKAQQNGYTNQGPKDLLKFLTKEQMDFLEQVAQRSYTVSELYRTLQVSGRKGNELKQSLERLELIDAIEDRTGKGMRKKIYLTPKGTELLENAGIAMY